MRNYLDIAMRIGLPIVVIAGGAAYRRAKTIARRLSTGPVRSWPTVTATIDVVSVAEQIQEGSYGSVETTGYVAALTYFYRNPELQMGEYTRTFPLLAEATRWSDSFKGKQVLVHVNPKDPRDSLLLKEALEGLGTSAAQPLDTTLHAEGMPKLKPGLHLLSSTAEFMSLLGLALTALALAMHQKHGTPMWLIVTLLLMLAFAFAADWIVHYLMSNANRSQALLNSSVRFSPAWMRWGMKVIGAITLIAWAIVELRDFFPATEKYWIQRYEQYWPFLVAFWIFLSSAALHAALLRSQESARGPDAAEAGVMTGPY